MSRLAAPATLQPEHMDPVRSASGTQRPSQEPSVVSPWLWAHTGAQRLRLSRHRRVTRGEAAVEVPQGAYQVREGQQAAVQVGRGSGGRAHPHPVYPPGLGKVTEGVDAQGGHLLDPEVQAGILCGLDGAEPTLEPQGRWLKGLLRTAPGPSESPGTQGQLH